MQDYALKMAKAIKKEGRKKPEQPHFYHRNDKKTRADDC